MVTSNLVPLALFILTLLPSLGVGLPLGIPPEMEDKTMQAAAPEKCLVWGYLTKSKIPNEKSEIPGEQLLYQLSQHVTDIMEHVLKNIPEEKDRDAIRKSLFRNVHTCFFLEDISPAAVSEKIPDIKFTMVLKLETLMDSFKNDLEKEYIPNLLRGFPDLSYRSETLYLRNAAKKNTPKQIHSLAFQNENASGFSLYWIYYESYLIMGLNRESVQNTCSRMILGNEPSWLHTIKEKNYLMGRSSLIHLNVQSLVHVVTRLIPDDKTAELNHKYAFLSFSGLSDVKSATFTTGFTADGTRCRAFLGVEPTHGPNLLQEITCGKLMLDDLKHVPNDVLLALAYKCQPLSSFIRLQNELDQFRIVQDAYRNFPALPEMNIMDFLECLDGSLVLFSAAEPSAEYTTVTLGLKNTDSANLFIKKLTDKIAAQDTSGKFKIYEYKGFTAYPLMTLQNDFIRPYMALVKDKLVLTTSRTQFKRYVNHISDMKNPDNSSAVLTDVPMMKDTFKKDAPFAMEYLNLKSMFETFYPLVRAGVALASTQWKDASGKQILPANLLPDFSVFEPYLGVEISTVTRTEEGILMQRHSPWPGDQLGTAMVAGTVAAAWLAPARAAQNQVFIEQKSIANIKQILSAMIKYEDLHERLPAAYTITLDRKPLLSWRVYMLPYLGQQDLYEQFKKDEPWDSPHNKALIKKMPDIFRSPDSSWSVTDGRTRYLTVRHPLSLFPPATAENQGRGKKIHGILDGVSNTVALVEADDRSAVIWTQPDDLIYVNDVFPADKLKSRGTIALIGLADGTVQRIPLRILKDIFKDLVITNDGKNVQWNDKSK